MLSDNKISVSIPPSISKLTSLLELRLDRNQISGLIPLELGELSKLSVFFAWQNQLEGSIPSTYILAVTALKAAFPCKSVASPGINFLDLSSNQITGTIPDDIGNGSHLQMLNISNNILSSEPLASLGSITSLLILDASFNQFSRPIPDSLGNGIPNELCEIEGLDIGLDLSRNISILGKLSVLDLSYNNLDDSLTELAGLNNLISLNVSNNNFTGYLPDTKLFHQLLTSDLAGNEGLCTHDGDVRFVSSNVNGVTSTTKESRRLYTLKLAIVLLIIVTLWLSTGGVAATSKEKGNIVRVRDSFSAEVRTLGAIRHKNIVRFLGCCWNKSPRLLMYDYMANGSLGGLLHDRNGYPLEWDLRYQIILWAAQGLAYLHHDCIPTIVHRNIKANNILIGLDFEPYIADFVLAKLVEEGDFARSSNTIVGSYGYIAPEYGYMMNITEESDVYCYGVVVLEVLIGKQPIDPTIPDGLHLADWVRMKKGNLEVLDVSLRFRSDSEVEEML
ncbi:hypothetical protein IEQ34_003012 [Dendrobium chrysotoxum]|uniref:Protein kinase domain-containing protein n=1 Tax=Dendrobium chrysotoxum TaxID=161865 RepID=A0AAV7HIK0_DENCH|nr:hypothetical protein IEQ34_003012 [Dendrobium chrysotoxum]